MPAERNASAPGPRTTAPNEVDDRIADRSISWIGTINKTRHEASPPKHHSPNDGQVMSKKSETGGVPHLQTGSWVCIGPKVSCFLVCHPGILRAGLGERNRATLLEQLFLGEIIKEQRRVDLSVPHGANGGLEGPKEKENDQSGHPWPSCPRSTTVFMPTVHAPGYTNKGCRETALLAPGRHSTFSALHRECDSVSEVEDTHTQGGILEVSCMNELAFLLSKWMTIALRV